MTGNIVIALITMELAPEFKSRSSALVELPLLTVVPVTPGAPVAPVAPVVCSPLAAGTVLPLLSGISFPLKVL